MSSAAFAFDTDTSKSSKSRSSSLRVNKPGDSYEVEADRVADTVVSGGRVSGLSASPWSFSSVSVGAVQRDSDDAPKFTPEEEEKARKKQAALDKLNHDLAKKSAGPSDPSPQANAVDPSSSNAQATAPKPNNYGEAATTTAGAILKTDVAKKEIEALKKQPIVKGAEKVLDSTAGKIGLGVAAAGTVGVLAATHQPLPVQPPGIPIGKSGFSVKPSVQGPLNRPTSAGLTLSYSPQKSPAEEKKARLRAAQDEHDARAWEAKDLRDFQQGLKTPEQVRQEKEDEQHLINNWALRPGALNDGIDVNKYIHPLTTEDAKKEELPVQRKAMPSAEMYADSDEVQSVVHSSGQRLDAETRRTMESRIGFDFSKVRIHNDAKAAASARSLGAHAYTVGSSVIFGDGQYAPQTTQGRRLLAHELTHVVQQSHDIARKPAGITQAPAHIQRDEDEKGPSLLDGPKGWVLNKLRKIPGYELFCTIIGKDLVTGAAKDRSPGTLLREVLQLVHAEEAYDRVIASGALQKASEWALARLDELQLNVPRIKGLIAQARASASAKDLTNISTAVERIEGIFKPAWDDVLTFADEAAHKLFEIAVQVVMERFGSLGQKVMGFLSKARDTFFSIAKDPVKFAGNLVGAVKLGFQNFAGKIQKHLQDALMEFLFGELGSKLTAPKAFSVSGIFNLILDVLDLHYDNFRQRMVEKTSEDTVSFVENSVDFVMKIAGSKSLAGAWNIFKDRASELIDNLVDNAVGAIKDWVVTKVVQAAIKNILELFNPASAIVAAIEAIYHTIVVLIEKAQQLAKVLQAVVNSITLIAEGNVIPAARWVEESMTKSFSFLIAFFAEQAGLGGISATIRKFIKAVKDKVWGVIDRVIDYALDKSRNMYARSKAAVGKVFGWWQQRKDFLVDGEEHSVLMEGTAEAPKLMVASYPKYSIGDYLDEVEKKSPKSGNTKNKKLIEEVKKTAPDLVAPISTPTPTPAAVGSNDKVKASSKSPAEEKKITMFAEIADRIRKLGFGKRPVPETTFKFEKAGPDEEGTQAAAPILSRSHPEGSAVSILPKIWTNLGDLAKKKTKRYKGYVQGHLMSRAIGGPGDEKRNLTPIRIATNSLHLNNVERHVKTAVNKKGVVLRYTVKANYNGSHPVSDSLRDLRAIKGKPEMKPEQTEELAELEAEQKLCRSLDWKVEFLEPDADDKWLPVKGKTLAESVPHNIHATFNKGK